MTAEDHALAAVWPQPSGWRARCRCGDTFHGIDRHHAETKWEMHRNEHRPKRERLAGTP